MMRRLLAWLALCAAAPLQAQDPPEWVGVWEGRIGELPVRACFDAWSDSPGRGSYYYLRYLEPISLSEEDGEGGWIERAPGGEAEALWEFAELSTTRMRGTWRQGRRSLPFSLDPVTWSDGDGEGPCGSFEFLSPRFEGGSVEQQSAELGGWSYTRRSYLPPTHLEDDVSIDSFTFAPEQPGDALIVAELTAYLPPDRPGDVVFECLAGALSQLGTDGFFEHVLSPAMVSREFLSLEETSSTFCGGAHPNYWTVTRTFDRRTGEELDLSEWLDWPREEGAQDPGMPAALRSLILARWPAESELDCRELAEDAAYWTLGLAREGLIFRPDFPHAATPCEEPVVVEWSALAPFLDDEGRAGLARLRVE